MSIADPKQLNVALELNRSDILFCLARVPQTSRLFVGSSDATIHEIDLADEQAEPKQLVGHRGYVTGLVLSGDYLVSAAYDGRLIWWDRRSRQQVRTVEAHRKWIRELRISPDGTIVASVADDMVCRLWDAESGRLLTELAGHSAQTPHHFPSMLFTCEFSPDGRLLATADKVGHIVVWDLAGGSELATIEAPTMYTWDPAQRIHSIGGVRSLAFSADARLLAAGGIGQIGNIDHLGALARVEVFDWQQGQRTHEFAGDEHKGLVEHLEFHPRGNWLLAAGGDHGGFMKFFDLKAANIIKQDKAPMHVHDLAMGESFDTVYAVGHNRIVVWDFKPSATDEPEPAQQ